jgi:hypothetical protein
MVMASDHNPGLNFILLQLSVGKLHPKLTILEEGEGIGGGI